MGRGRRWEKRWCEEVMHGLQALKEDGWRFVE